MVTTITYVTYYCPGLLFPEETVKPVDVRDPQQQANKAPANAFSFYYYDIVRAIVYVDGERVETSSEPRNISKVHYIDAKLLNYDEVSALPGDNATLLGNMRGNGWHNVVLCRTGNFQPFDPARHQLVTTS
jgi:hypothetical protein